MAEVVRACGDHIPKELIEAPRWSPPEPDFAAAVSQLQPRGGRALGAVSRWWHPGAMVDIDRLMTPQLRRLRHSTRPVPDGEMSVGIITSGDIRVKTVDVPEIHIFEPDTAPESELRPYGLAIGGDYLGPAVGLTEVWIPSQFSKQLPVDLLVRGRARGTTVQLHGGIDAPIYLPGGSMVFGCKVTGRYVAFGDGDFQVSSIFDFPNEGDRRPGSLTLEHVVATASTTAFAMHRGAKLSLVWDRPPGSLDVQTYEEFFVPGQIQMYRSDDPSRRVCEPFQYSISFPEDVPTITGIEALPASSRGVALS